MAWKVKTSRNETILAKLLKETSAKGRKLRPARESAASEHHELSASISRAVKAIEVR